MRKLYLKSFKLIDGEGSGTPLQYSCLENPMDGGAWWAAVHGVTTSQIWLSNFTFTFHFHALEKEMATHSSVLAWRIPETGELGGLPSMVLHRVRHDWSDLAAAAAAPHTHHTQWDPPHIVSPTLLCALHAANVRALGRFFNGFVSAFMLHKACVLIIGYFVERERGRKMLTLRFPVPWS